MALIGEAARQGDFGKREILFRKQPGSMADARLTKELANGAIEMAAKFAREMHLVHARNRGELSKAGRLQVMYREHLANAAQPSWNRFLGALAMRTHAFRENFEDDTFEGD